MRESIEQILNEAGVTSTPVRILVYKCLNESKTPLSLTEIEILLDTVDKSTISRTLTTFKEHQLVHSFNDGSGSAKYEICNSQDKEEDDDEHVHFRCESCGVTSCLPSIKVPEVELPEGYEAYEKNYVIVGKCPKCSHKNTEK